MTICLHLGAHKTASTHLQQALWRAGGGLAATGCTYLGPHRLRHDLACRTVETAGPLRDAVAAGQKTGRVLLSDENLMGTTRADMLAQGAVLYPYAADRLAQFLRLLGATQVDLALGLRAPLDFLTASYGQQVIAGNLITPDAFLADMVPAALRWSDLVRRLLDVPGVTRITLWRYEDYPAILGALLPALVGPDAAPRVQPAAERAKPGLSARALDMARAEVAAKPDLPPREVVARARALYPKSPTEPGIGLFDKGMLESFARDYDTDIADVAKWSRVQVLTGSVRLGPVLA